LDSFIRFGEKIFSEKRTELLVNRIGLVTKRTSDKLDWIVDKLDWIVSELDWTISELD